MGVAYALNAYSRVESFSDTMSFLDHLSIKISVLSLLMNLKLNVNFYYKFTWIMQVVCGYA
jgi:hypothetical protein